MCLIPIQHAETTNKYIFNFQKGDGEDGEVEPEPEDTESPLPNIMELYFYFEQAGVGLNREEMIRIWLALKNLNDNHPLQHIRFWGKIFGTEQNYIVAEVEYREGEDEEEEEEENENAEEEESPEKDEDAEDEGKRTYQGSTKAIDSVTSIKICCTALYFL